MVDFLKYKRIYFLISAFVIGLGLFFIFRFGLAFSIDFTGGTTLSYRSANPIPAEEIKTVLAKESIVALSLTVDERDISIRTHPQDEKKEARFRKQLAKSFGTEIQLLKFETVGPLVGEETVRKTVIASIVGVAAILIYMSFTFRGLNFAFSAILALLHDMLVLVGVYSIVSYFTGAEIDTLFITALLTTMSFSVHDTIVIFDKIREYVKQEGKINIENIANRALTQTLVRSINNSMTIVFMLLALILLGGSTIRFFIIALLIGILTGTYSSPFIATPILVFLEKRKR